VLPVRLREIDKSLKDPDSWFIKFADLQAEGVAKALRLEWEDIRSPAIISFRNALFSFKPTSLIHCSAKPGGCTYGGWWLRLKGPPNYHEWENEVFLHAPPDPAAPDEWIGHRDYPERDVLVEFCSHFYSLVNSMEGSASGFYPPPWATLAEGGFYQDVDDHDHFDPERKWEHACLFYCTFSGECILLNADGRVGWYLAAEQKIRLMASSFSEFLEQCAFCYRIYGILHYHDAWETSPYAAFWTDFSSR
jgi:hypothetical protein